MKTLLSAIAYYWLLEAAAMDMDGPLPLGTQSSLRFVFFHFQCARFPSLPLAGVSIDPVEVSLPEFGLKQSGPLLITHWGFSGPEQSLSYRHGEQGN